MKSQERFITIVLLMLMASTTLFYACKESNPVSQESEHRLFRPVLNEQLSSEGNTIIVDMGNMEDALSYTLEVSRDTFQTIELTMETDTSHVEIDSLLWDTIYQVRATAHADDPELNSKVSDLGAVKTQRFPTIMELPGRYDVTDVAARVFWETGGAPVTGVKVFAGEDERLENPLKEVDVTAEERDAEEKFVRDLDPDTEYQLAIYSDGENGSDKLRGWAQYKTKEALPMGDNVVDLRKVSYRESALSDTLPYVPNGSTVLLESGKQYTADGYHFDKSVTIRSAYGFEPGGAKIHMNSNFNVQDGATVDSVVFHSITLHGNFDSDYVFNINNSGQVGEIKFQSSNIRSLRGITRMKGGAGKLKKYTFNDTVVDSINGYGVITVNVPEWSVDDFNFENSTFSRIKYFVVSYSNSNSINVESCTFNQAPRNGGNVGIMFFYRGDDGNNDVLNGIKVHNTIWGHAWDVDGVEDYTTYGFYGGSNTTFDIVNTYTTQRFEFRGGYEIPGFPNYVYNGTASDLWLSPYTGDFNINDSQFAGKGDAGDPRWRIGF